MGYINYCRKRKKKKKKKKKKEEEQEAQISHIPSSRSNFSFLLLFSPVCN